MPLQEGGSNWPQGAPRGVGSVGPAHILAIIVLGFFCMSYQKILGRKNGFSMGGHGSFL